MVATILKQTTRDGRHPPILAAAAAERQQQHEARSRRRGAMGQPLPPRSVGGGREMGWSIGMEQDRLGSTQSNMTCAYIYIYMCVCRDTDIYLGSDRFTHTHIGWLDRLVVAGLVLAAAAGLGTAYMPTTVRTSFDRCVCLPR
jgi:hypothetical protein